MDIILGEKKRGEDNDLTVHLKVIHQIIDSKAFY